MTTFSQLVDEMVLETKRPDLVTEIAAYLNQTIRELHFRPSTNPERTNAILYRSNLVELTLAVDTEDAFSWTIPNLDRYQAIAAVRYDEVYDNCDKPVYATERVPGRTLNQELYFYYRAADYVVFSGHGGLNSTISLAYYEYPRAMKYYLPANRLASYDVEDGWIYDASITTDEQRLEQREKTSNWLLIRWKEVVKEGVRAKVYKRTADDTRSRTSYSLYAQLRQGLFTSEIATQDSVY